MDQLKIVLEHRFWILAGLAILLPPIGWWAATNNIADDTEARIKKIDSAEKSLATVKDVPNERWIQGAKEIGKELTASVAESQKHLFEHQKGVMKFPQIVQDALDKCHLKYRQDGTTQDFLAAKEFFVGCYAGDWKSALDIVKPFKVTTGEGLVLLPLDNTGPGSDVSMITRHYEVEGWRQTLGFTAAQMYDAEEDIWFLKTLMQAIAKVNEGTTEIGNARIKRVLQVVLRGGDLSDLATRRNPKPGGSGGAAGAASKTPRASMSVNFGRSGGGGESNYKPPKAFDPDDVFGDDGSKDAGTTGRRDAVSSVELKRWVEGTPKYSKRGFVLKLVMDEREIPTLLTALTDSPFPIEIKHVEHQAYTGRSGSEFAQINNALNETAEGVEQTKEQKQQQQRIIEGLRMAFNVNFLAEVTVAGTLTIYNEPTAAASKSSAKSGATQPATTSAPSSTRAVTGKAAPGTSAKTGPAAAKSSSAAQGKAAPGTGAPAAKGGSPTVQPSSAKAGPAGKSATTGK
jgi:hypothetical protein